jgi:hypothetical protein
VSIKRAIGAMKEKCVDFKGELFLIPKSRESEFKSKYAEYQEKIKTYEK